jgi:hypothetical protein
MDKKSLVCLLAGHWVEKNKAELAMEKAVDWINEVTKEEIIVWANENNVNIGQSGTELIPDWNLVVVEEYAYRLI